MAYKDPEEEREYQRRWYRENRAGTKKYRDYKRAKQDVIRKRNREFLRSYKETHPCVDCGESRWQTLDFDHLEEKRGNLSDMVGNCFSIQVLNQEISKCEVRCANCHRVRTWERQQDVAQFG